MTIQGIPIDMASVSVIGGAHRGLLGAIRLSSRVPLDGAETELIDCFLARGIRKGGHGTRITAFVEPRLASGFPDIVIAYWRPRVFEAWDVHRSSLGVDDVRILHFLHGVRSADMETLCRMLDPKRKRVAESLKRLHLAKLVRFRGGLWVPRALDRVFGIRDLIAVEAKVRDWRRALEQARLNRWFASVSCVLMPTSSVHEAVIDQATAYGVGVIGRDGNGHLDELLEPAADEIPRSYGSWLFNEWVGRSITHAST